MLIPMHIAKETLKSVLDAGYLDKLIELAQSKDDKVIKDAIVIIAILSELGVLFRVFQMYFIRLLTLFSVAVEYTEPIHTAFMAENVIRRLIALLSFSFSAEIQDESASILNSISQNGTVPHHHLNYLNISIGNAHILTSRGHPYKNPPQ